MKFFQCIVRADLTCAILSVVLASANAWAGLTDKQAEILAMKVLSAGDKAAMQTLTTEAQHGNKYAQSARQSVKRIGALATKAWSGNRAALKTLRAEGQAGNKYAQFELGDFYSYQNRDAFEAVRWYRKAAKQGVARAQSALGLMYEIGVGVSRQGLLYDEGEGVLENDHQAVQWYRKAAEQGDVWAQASLGHLYADGRGVPQNKVVAYALYSLPDLPFNHRSELAKTMTEQEIDAGRVLYREMSVKGNLLRAIHQYLTATVPARP